MERAPFDSPEAETEIVSGVLVEYSGRLLAFFKWQWIVKWFLLSRFSRCFSAVCDGHCLVDFLLYIVKTLAFF